MKKVLLTRIFPAIARELLSPHFQVDECDKPPSAEELQSAVKKYDGILSSYADVIDANILREATQLKVISNYAVGLDNISVDFARSKGIKIFHLPDVVTQSSADLTFALFLSFIRKIPQAREYVEKGHWQYFDPLVFLGEELCGKTFGIVGFGRIGKAVAKRALGFGLKVIFYNRSQATLEEDLEGRVKQVSWDDLLKMADYISLHVPLSQETKGMINLDAMSRMEKKPVLINMARGAVVNTDDLVIALEKGFLRGAALDVTSPEPISSSHPLCMFENCMIIPHIGTATVECRTQMAKLATENLLSYLT